MIRIFIQGIKDGEYNIDMDTDVSEVPDILEEFFGNIHIEGKLKKFGSRFTLIAEAECSAKLICDRSLKEFVEEIPVEIKLSFIANPLKSPEINDETQEIFFHPDDKYLDITEEVREIFAISLPMKRVAPEYRNKDLKDLYPEYVKTDDNISGDIDDRWAPLKNLISN
jgi:uncharacterized metal-binding protein YceD (DUF177 family)